MYLRMAKRMLTQTDKRLLWKLAYNFGLKGMLSVLKFKRRLRRGEYFPPFLYISVINSCNLRCQGCWVDVAAKQQIIDQQALNRLIGEAKDAGNYFFGILGGEPLMHPELLDALAAHPDCYFQLFTNGQLITDEVAARLRQMGNVTPLVSIEGTQIVSDQRRGRPEVLNRTLEGLNNCIRHRLITGVATSVCQTNIDDLLSLDWVDRLIEMGVLYVWYHVYRPVGPDSCPDLALTPEQQLRVRKFVVDLRVSRPIGVIDAYYDHQGKALCPAATGISHHISPWGDIEPCPIVQFAKESIHANGRAGEDRRTLKEKFIQSEFLHDFRQTAAQATRGCIVLERPDLIEELVEKHGAPDTTARHAALAELQAMTHRQSQYNPGAEVPERSWMYYYAKKFFFNDFGAYSSFGKRTVPTKTLHDVTPAPSEQPVA